MADKIEILQNTITKLLIRRGTNNDRQAVVLDLGEPGYTTDTQRLFIGDGITPGGILAGNKFLGEVNTPTAITTALTGDVCYATRSGVNQYYTSFIKTTNTNFLSSWTPVVPVAATPKAWVSFDGYSNTFPATATILASHNVRLVENPSQGKYKIYFTNTFANTAYAVSFGNSGSRASLKVETDDGTDDGPCTNAKKTTFIQVVNTNSTGALTGTRSGSVFIFTNN